MSVENLITTMMQEFREIVKTETVVGKPMVLGETVIVPVSKISFGFGAGGGKDGAKNEGGSGTGGGGSVEPVAFIVVQKGKVQLLPLEDKRMSIGKVLALAPDILKKVREFREKREDKKRAAEVDKEEASGQKPEEKEQKDGV